MSIGHAMNCHPQLIPEERIKKGRWRNCHPNPTLRAPQYHPLVLSHKEPSCSALSINLLNQSPSVAATNNRL